MRKNSCFFRLQKWFHSQCDGDWEHQHGITIDTIDNPGWSLFIDLRGTALETKEFKKFTNDITNDNWIHCWIGDSQFQAGGGPQNLEEIIKIFVSWTEELVVEKNTNEIDLGWLQKWYHSQCNGDWEHEYGITIGTLDNPGWSVFINLIGTDLEDKNFKKIEDYRTEDDWIFCIVEKNMFKAACGSFNLIEAIQIFRKWTESCSEL